MDKFKFGGLCRLLLFNIFCLQQNMLDTDSSLSYEKLKSHKKHIYLKMTHDVELVVKVVFMLKT